MLDLWVLAHSLEDSVPGGAGLRSDPASEGDEMCLCALVLNSNEGPCFSPLVPTALRILSQL